MTSTKIMVDDISLVMKEKFNIIEVNKEADFVIELIKEILDFINEVDDIEFTVELHKAELVHAVKSYHLDVIRHKIYYGYYDSGDEINNAKKASFFTKWFLKIKPLKISECKNYTFILMAQYNGGEIRQKIKKDEAIVKK